MTHQGNGLRRSSSENPPQVSSEYLEERLYTFNEDQLKEIWMDLGLSDVLPFAKFLSRFQGKDWPECGAV